MLCKIVYIFGNSPAKSIKLGLSYARVYELFWLTMHTRRCMCRNIWGDVCVCAYVCAHLCMCACVCVLVCACGCVFYAWAQKMVCFCQ